VGLLAAVLTYHYLAKERASAVKMTQPRSVVVTTKPIAARTIIEPSAIRVTTLPPAALPANCATSVDEVIGKVTLASLGANEPVIISAVAPRTASLGLAYSVPAGERAVAVALDPIIGVAGFLKPGDRVDVVATFTVDKLKVAKTVLQDVTLLAIGPEVNPAKEKKFSSDKAVHPSDQPNATLAVTPEQAEKLILAESWGKLRLTLRPADDRSIVSLTGIRSDVLIGTRLPSPSTSYAAPVPRQNSPAVSTRASAPPPRVASPRPVAIKPHTHDAFNVETIRGTQRTTIEVNEQ